MAKIAQVFRAIQKNIVYFYYLQYNAINTVSWQKLPKYLELFKRILFIFTICNIMQLIQIRHVYLLNFREGCGQ